MRTVRCGAPRVSSIRLQLVSLILAGLAAACASPSSGSSSSASPSATPSPAVATPFAVQSTNLASGHWPAQNTCDGDDNPPDLRWTAGPSGTRAYALQLFDPDAPNGGFTHWMLANEPADLRQPTPGTGISGKNDFGREGYGGPCPPKGTTHHYVFFVYALDSTLSLSPLYRHPEFERALKGHVLARADLTATYAR
jgi:Raf kinase inhibitor-like YbhB/YbcL family protein